MVNITRRTARGVHAPPGERGGPVILCSAGSFLLVVGAALMLPGRDINALHQSDQEVRDAAASWVAPMALHLPPTTAVRYIPSSHISTYHWRLDCPVLTTRPRRGWVHRSTTTTYAEASRRGMR